MVSHCMETICPFHGYIHVSFIPSVDGDLGCCHFLIVVVVVAQSCLTLCDHMDCSLPGSSVHGDSPGKNTGVDSHSLLQGIFPNQRSNPSLLHCIQILYHLSYTFGLLWIMLLWRCFCVNICFQFSLLEIELLDHIVTLCLTFWWNARLFSKVLVNFTFSATVCEGSSLPISLPTLVITHPFYYSQPNEVEMVFHRHFDLHEILNKFWTRGPHFHFTLGFANDVLVLTGQNKCKRKYQHPGSTVFPCFSQAHKKLGCWRKNKPPCFWHTHQTPWSNCWVHHQMRPIRISVHLLP